MYRHATYEQSEYVVMKELRKSNNLYEVLKVQNLYGLVAQLVRAPPCHGGGHEFESRLGRLCSEY